MMFRNTGHFNLRHYKYIDRMDGLYLFSDLLGILITRKYFHFVKTDFRVLFKFLFNKQCKFDVGYNEKLHILIVVFLLQKESYKNGIYSYKEKILLWVDVVAESWNVCVCVRVCVCVCVSSLRVFALASFILYHFRDQHQHYLRSSNPISHFCENIINSEYPFEIIGHFVITNNAWR